MTSDRVGVWIVIVILLLMAVLTSVYGLLTALISISEGQSHVPPLSAWLEWLVPTSLLFICELTGAVGLMFRKRWGPFAAFVAVLFFIAGFFLTLGNH